MNEWEGERVTWSSKTEHQIKIIMLTFKHIQDIPSSISFRNWKRHCHRQDSWDESGEEEELHFFCLLLASRNRGWRKWSRCLLRLRWASIEVLFSFGIGLLAICWVWIDVTCTYAFENKKKEEKYHSLYISSLPSLPIPSIPPSIHPARPKRTSLQWPVSETAIRKSHNLQFPNGEFQRNCGHRVAVRLRDFGREKKGGVWHLCGFGSCFVLALDVWT